MKPKTLLWLVVTWVAFGSLFVVAKIGVGIVPPLILAALRFLIAGPLLLAFGLRTKNGDAPDVIGWKQIALSALVAIVLAYLNGMVMLASTQMDSWLVSVLTCTIPLWCYAISVLFAHKPVQGVEIGGLFAGIAGIVFLLLPSNEAVHVSVPLSLLLLLGAVCWAGVTVFEKSTAIPKRPLVAMGLQCAIAGIFLTGWSAAAGEWHVSLQSMLTPGAIFAILYLAIVGSVLGYGAYMWLIVNSGATIANSFGYVSPAISVFLGWAILHEPVTVRTFIGFGLVVVAVAAIVAPHPMRKPPAVPLENKIHR